MGTDGNLVGAGPEPRVAGIPTYVCKTKCSTPSTKFSLPLSHLSMIKNMSSIWKQLWKKQIVFEGGSRFSGGSVFDKTTLASMTDTFRPQRSFNLGGMVDEPSRFRRPRKIREILVQPVNKEGNIHEKAQPKTKKYGVYENVFTLLSRSRFHGATTSSSSRESIS